MKTLLRSFVCFVCFAGLSATAHAQKNVQKSDATATRDEITADLKFGTGKTGTFLTGSALTLNSGSTLTLNGALAGTPTGGTLSLANLTLTLGTPAALTLTNATGLPIATGVSGLGTGVATFLATPSSANLAAAVTGETGSGALVFGTSPTLTTPVIASIVNTGTLTLPTATDTLIGRATTDTLTNKSISGATNTFSAIPNSALGNASLTIGSTNIALGGTSTTLAGLSSLTGATDLTLSGGSSGASLALGSGASGTGTLSINTRGVRMDSAAGFTGASDIVTGGAALLFSHPTSGNYPNGLYSYTGTGSVNNFFIGARDDLVFGSGGVSFASANPDRMRLKASGNLLIGTTTDMASTAGGLTVAATGSGATATAVNTGGLRSANFGLSTVSGGASYFGGDLVVPATYGLLFGAGGNDRITQSATSGGSLIFDAGGITRITTNSVATNITNRLQVGSALTDYITEILDTSAAATGLRAKNESSSASAYSQLAVNAFGNSWGFRMGSSAANSNALEFISDITAPAVRFSMTPAGAATFAGAVTHTLGTNYPPQTAPASPASGWVLYTDSGDGNKLKAKASTGTVVTIGTP